MKPYIFLTLLLLSNSALVAESNISTTTYKPEEQYKNLKTFLDALHAIEGSYVQEVSRKKLIHGAINGMLRELDPHSYFLPKEQLKQFKKEVRGQFSGLGLELTIKNKYPVIISVLAKSPALKAGLRPGQIILQINGKKTSGLNKNEVFNMLKGPRGKVFNLIVKTANSKKLQQVRIKSKFISLESVLSKDFGKGLLYIRINAFTERTYGEIRKVISKYASSQDFVSKECSALSKNDICNWMGIILDLRGNPGGLLESAIKVADLFITKGRIVSVKGRIKNYEKIFKASSQNTFSYVPLLVLIDSYSASAAEVLAGALKENKRSLLLGRKTFGKASVQSLVPLANDSAIKLTVAHYYTPEGNSIHKQGIKPDIELSKPKLLDKEHIQYTSEKDTDFQKALYLLKMFKYFSANPLSDI